MHARHRSPGNGYRSGSMSMGLSASRISPESSVRGHGLYNSEYRSFNRGFGRCQGQPKSFPPPSTPPRRSTGGDIFMEAGRLAAEYLVSQGFLAPSVLSGKWQNGSLKNQAGELQEFRSHDNENLHLPPPDVRPSALSRLGNSVSDAGLGRRRYVDDYSSTGSRSHLKGRRQGGSFRYGSDFGREYGRSGSWSERNRGSSDVEGDDDTIPAHHEEQPVGKDVGSGIQKPSSGELATKVEEAGESETELDKNNFQDETRSSCIGKDSPHDGEVSTKPENSPVELKNENDENQKLVAVEGETPQPEEGDSSGKKNVTDLLTLCKFPNLRTKTRSALMVKGSRSDSVSNRVGTTSDVKPLVEEDPLNNSSRDLLSNKNHDLQLPDCDNSKALSVPEYGGVLVPEEDAEQAKCHSYQSFPNRVLVDDNEQEEDQGLTGLMRSTSMILERGEKRDAEENDLREEANRQSSYQSFPNRILVDDNEQEEDQGLTGLIRSTSMIQERGEKRAAEENDLREVAKRQREWLPSVASKSDECFSIPSVNEKEETPEEEKPSQSEEVTMAVDHGSLVNNHRIPVGGDEPCIQDAQEKQLFPSSFKICDLNLVGVADLNENNHGDPMLVFPPISEIKKKAGPVDVDLSMSSSNKSGEYGGHTSNGKEIEVIDLESDSTQELKAGDILDRKQQSVFLGFPNHTQNNGDITDVTDFNDGLMMVEFLNSLANLPHVPPGMNPVSEEINHATQDVNSLQNEMSLHNGEGTLGDQGPLGDDDSIYMSLGEIPLSYLRGWEQPPPQEYEKPF